MAMLNTLKNLVYQKHIFAEQAKMVLDEDENFDSLILLEAEGVDPELPDGSKDPLQNDNAAVQPEGEQPMPIENDSPSVDTTNDDRDIMNAELDIGTDTVKNVVPSPPPNAVDQIDTADSPNGGNIMDEPIDGPIPTKDNSSDIMNEPIDQDGSLDKPEDDSTEGEPSEYGNVMDDPIDSDEENDEDGMSESFYNKDVMDTFLEDITLDGGGDSSSGDNNSSEGEKAPDEDLDGAEDNTVTSAVKEKVKDSSDESSPEPAEPSDDMSDEPLDDGSMEAPGGIANKEELVKKVASITKSNVELLSQIQSAN